MLRGIDISNWQKNIIPSNLDIDFCICKATEGTYFVDKFCDAFIQNLKSKNMLWGFYHFASSDDPEKEASFFYENCRGYIGEGIPVLDYEVWQNNENDIAWCEAFISKFHDLASVWPMIYISASHCKDFANSWIPQKCGLWVAGYPKDINSWVRDDMPYDISPWPFCAIWQFTSSLVLSGYSSSLDGDIAYMDKSAWGKYAQIETPIENQPDIEQKKKITITLDGKKLVGYVREKQ